MLSMKQAIVHIALVVKDYDEAIEFYTKKLHFTVIDDTYQSAQKKRWVVVSPPGSMGTTLLLAKASKVEQNSFIGNQTGGRVFLFLSSNNFMRDYKDMLSRGIKFVRDPKEESYGTVAVFKDLYGNLWDLVEFTQKHLITKRLLSGDWLIKKKKVKFFKKNDRNVGDQEKLIKLAEEKKGGVLKSKPEETKEGSKSLSSSNNMYVTNNLSLFFREDSTGGGVVINDVKVSGLPIFNLK